VWGDLGRQPEGWLYPVYANSETGLAGKLLRFRLANNAAVAHNSGCASCSTLHRDVNERVGPRATPSYGRQRCVGAALAKGCCKTQGSTP